jgi:hypothetical protein
MKIDQIAFYCSTDEQANQIKDQFSLRGADWVKDTVTAMSKVWDFPEQPNKAELQFNYDLGIELEILRYISGKHWHDPATLLNPKQQFSVPFISHVGIHLEDGEDFPQMAHCKLVQETWTLSHTAPYLTTGPAAGRRYHYRIFELSPGSYIKYIRRIHPK